MSTPSSIVYKLSTHIYLTSIQWPFTIAVTGDDQSFSALLYKINTVMREEPLLKSQVNTNKFVHQLQFQHFHNQSIFSPILLVTAGAAPAALGVG